MEAARALADLLEISSQVDAAVAAAEDGTLLGSTLDDERARRLADGARRLLERAQRTGDGRAPAQLEAATPQGSVFVVREGGRLVAALTGPQPTVGLVFYDLKTCLRGLAEEPAPVAKAKPKRKPRAATAAPKRTPRRAPRRRTEGPGDGA